MTTGDVQASAKAASEGSERPQDPAAGEGQRAPPVPTRAERLAYIANLAGSLKGMAFDARCWTLAELLELAEREAKRQRTGPSGS
jgi:hypothetical protein